MNTKSESTLLRHGHCTDCGSSDALGVYDDGHTFCFSCNKHTQSANPSDHQSHPQTKTAAGLIDDITYEALAKRGLSLDTCKFWKYGTALHHGNHVQVACYYTADGTEMVAQKVRSRGKKFSVLGDMKKAGLFGQNLWRDTGRMVVITEGEIDALSVSQLQNNKWPVVSLQNGAAAAKKSIQRSLEWLEKFDSVVLMFDNDEAGQAAIKDCAEVLSPGKVKIARLPLKDANEMLVAGRGKEVIDALWGAKEYRPDGIIAGVDMWEKIIAVDSTESLAYPWSGLQAKTLGLRRGEIATFTAGTGIGKSQLCREIAFKLHEGGDTVGYVALEESVKNTAMQMMSLQLGQRLHVARATVPQEKLKAAFDATIGSGRFFLYDHWGSTDSDNLIAKIRYLVKGCGCSTIVLDHLSIVVSGQEDGDERRIIDNTMTKLRTLVEEVQCRMLLVSHLKRPVGQGHEDGARTALSQLRGSAAIGQLSDIVVGLERDQQHPEKKNVTLLRVLKNRWTGETGEAGYLEYSTDTGRLTETFPEFNNEVEEAAGDSKGNNDF